LQKVYTKQLNLVNLAVISIIMNYLPKINGKDNYLKSRLSLLDPFGTTQSKLYCLVTEAHVC